MHGIYLYLEEAENSGELDKLGLDSGDMEKIRDGQIEFINQ